MAAQLHAFLPAAAPRTERHVVEQNLDALRRIGVLAGARRTAALVLVPGRSAERAVDALLAEHGIAPQRFVQLHPGSRWLFKCWPAEQHGGARRPHRGRRPGASSSPGRPDARERALIDAMLAAVRPADACRASSTSAGS